MEININQKKQQAIKALKNGKLIEAKNLFQDILITNADRFIVSFDLKPNSFAD